MNHPNLEQFKEVLKTDFATFYLNDVKDTLIVKYRASTEITLEVAKEALTVIKPFKEAGSVYAIIDFSAPFLSMTNEAKQYFRAHVSIHNTYLVGIIVRDTAHKVLANMYARFDKPIIPTRVFTSVKEANSWITENLILFNFSQAELPLWIILLYLITI